MTNGDSTVASSRSSGSTRCRGATRCTRGRWSRTAARARAEFLGVDEARVRARATATLDDARGRLRPVVRGRSLRPAPDRRDPLRGCEDAGAVTLRQIGEHVGIPHFGGLGELAAGAAAGAPRGRAHRRRARARRARLGRADRARAAAGCCEIGARRASCASWARRSSASRRSTRGAATGSRSPSGGCWRARPARSTSCSGAPGARRRARSWATRWRSRALDRLAPLLRRRRRRPAPQRRGERVLARRGASSSPSAGSAASTSRPTRPWRWDEARETIERSPTLAERPGGCPVADLPWPSDVQGHAPHARGAARPGDDGERRRVHPRGRSRGARSRTRSATAATLPTWASCGSTSTTTAWCRSRSRWTATGCSPRTPSP